MIVGANACGKSTLLRGLARLLKPRGGTVLLDGEDIHRLPTKEVATRLGILPQQPIAPEGITVADLVARGRHPHQRWLRQFSVDDEAAVDAALDATGITDLADRSVDELSGGQRQRVWIALALAQGTPLCSSTSPRRSSTSPTRSRCSTCSPASTRSRAARSCSSSTTSTWPAATPTTWSPCGTAHRRRGPAGGRHHRRGRGRRLRPRCVVIDDPLTGTPLVIPVPARPVSGGG